MSMTGSGLSAEIKSAIESAYGPAQDDVQLQKFCDALGNSIVTYIQDNAVVHASGSDPQGGTVVSTGTVS